MYAFDPNINTTHDRHRSDSGLRVNSLFMFSKHVEVKVVVVSHGSTGSPFPLTPKSTAGKKMKRGGITGAVFPVKISYLKPSDLVPP